MAPILADMELPSPSPGSYLVGALLAAVAFVIKSWLTTLLKDHGWRGTIVQFSGYATVALILHHLALAMLTTAAGVVDWPNRHDLTLFGIPRLTVWSGVLLGPIALTSLLYGLQRHVMLIVAATTYLAFGAWAIITGHLHWATKADLAVRVPSHGVDLAFVTWMLLAVWGISSAIAWLHRRVAFGAAP